MIKRFIGEWSALSNFEPVNVRYEDITYPSVEHAYVASKTLDISFRRNVAAMPANQAGLVKKWGRTVDLRPNWKNLKVEIMHELLLDKFQQQPFKDLLMRTENQKLIEGNFWHDNFWGDCFCKKCKDIPGENMLGIDLMGIREFISTVDEEYTNVEITS